MAEGQKKGATAPAAEDGAKFYSKQLQSAGQIAEPSLRLVYEYWLGKCEGGRAPGKGAIDVLDLAMFASKLILIDVIEGDDFLFRLVGTDVAERFGIDPTGLCLSALPGDEFVSTSTEMMKAVTRERQPYWHEPKSSVFPNREYLTYEYIVLPLADESGAISQILTAIEFSQDEDEI